MIRTPTLNGVFHSGLKHPVAYWTSAIECPTGINSDPPIKVLLLRSLSQCMSSPLDSEEARRSETTTESALFFILNTQTRYFLRSVGLCLSLCHYLSSDRSHSHWIPAITPCHQFTRPGGHSSGHILKHIAKHFSQLPGACRMKTLILNLVSRSHFCL